MSLAQRALALFEPSPKALLSPAADFLMAGGAAILLFLVFRFLIPLNTNMGVWGMAVYYCAFLVNYPHFAASYQIMYGDAKKDFAAIKTQRVFALRLWWAGILVPILLLAYFLYALSANSNALMGYLVNAMFFFVGWHYIKQIFGCMMVLSSAKKIFYTKVERWILLVPLYSLWALSFVSANIYGGLGNYYQIPYTALTLPHILIPIAYSILGVSSLILVGMFVRKYRRDKSVPPISGLAALASIYIWYIPALSSPYYFAIIPFFHSLQYLLFVSAYKRNQSIATAAPIEASKRTAAVGALTYVMAGFFMLVPAVLIIVALKTNFAQSFEGFLNGLYGTLSGVSASVWAWTILAVASVILALLLAKLLARVSAFGRALSFVLGIVIVGALLFSIIPVTLDILAKNALLPSFFLYSTATFGTTLYLFFFTIFVNIHHYFVDNVLWKRENPHVREYLMYKP